MSAELLPRVSCPICGEIGKVSRLSRPETVSVRGLEVSVIRVLRKCEACGEEFENTRDHDWKADAYAAYRREKGFCAPEELREWRVAHWLTQAEMGRLLGWGEATLGRYESGSLPTDAQHRQLAAFMTPAGLAQALEDYPGAVSDEKKKAIMAKLRASLMVVRGKQMLVSVAGCFRADLLTGNREFDVFRATALVSILALGGEFKTKLNKLMFYADFCAFRDLGASISGLRYASIPYGPVPNDYDSIYAAMAAMDVVSVEAGERNGYHGEIVKSRSEIPSDFLSPEEIQLAEKIKSHFLGWSATRIKNYSHKERAWKEVGVGSAIPYDYADTLQLKL